MSPDMATGQRGRLSGESELHPKSCASTSRKGRAAVIAYLKPVVPHYDLSVPGGVVLVTQGGASRSFAFGDAQLHPRRPMRITDRFAIGSNTKTMFAVLVLQLAHEGKLSLGDTVQRWLPGLIKAGRKITIEDLLSHRSGLLDVPNAPHASWAGARTSRTRG